MRRSLSIKVVSFHLASNEISLGIMSERRGRVWFLQGTTGFRLTRLGLLTRCRSAGQVPTGQMYLCATTSSNPAPLRRPSRRGPGQGSVPALRDALRNSRLNLRLACSGLREPSGDTQLTSRSMNSTNPPGLVCL